MLGAYHSSQELSKSIVQDSVKKKREIRSLKGTNKCAILVDDEKCKDLIMMSFYNSKRIYFISNAYQKVQCIKKPRNFQHKEMIENELFILLSKSNIRLQFVYGGCRSS